MSELYVVVAYDVRDDRRRLRVSRILCGYGYRLQYSVFECQVSRVQFLRMKERVKEAIDSQEDRVFFYVLCGGCRERIERVGGSEPLLDDAVIIGG